MNSLLKPVQAITEQDPLIMGPETSCAEALTLFSKHKGGFQTKCCVLAEDGRLLGLVSLKDCLNRSNASDPVSAVLQKRFPTVDSFATAEATALEMAEEQLDIMPVIGTDGRLAGVVQANKAHRFLIEELQEDADRFVGVTRTNQDDYFEHTVWSDFRRRFPWVLVLAIAGLAAGYVVHIYEDALDALVILALYMPMVADTGGNVGTQSASLVTRVLTTGDVRMHEGVRILWREARVALLMAAMLFTFAFLKVLLISNVADVPDGMTLTGIGLAIAVALAAQVVSATLIGAVLPLAAIAVRQDPAVVSGPALTTIVDMTGLLLYFAITTSMLGIVAL